MITDHVINTTVYEINPTTLATIQALSYDDLSFDIAFPCPSSGS